MEELPPVVPQEKKNILFREKAVKHMGSPDQLGALLHVTRPRSWLALSGLILFLLILVSWSVWGTVPSMVMGQCILLPEAGGARIVSMPETGYVARFVVHVNDQVTQGQVLALIYDTQLKSTRPLIASSDGVIVDLLAPMNQMLAVGSPLVLIQPGLHPLSSTLISQVFIKPADGKKVLPGMSVLIGPDQANPDRYGYLKGVVHSVSLYPKTEVSLEMLLGNPTLARMLMLSGPPYQVTVMLLKDKHTPSGYAWTSQKGYSARIGVGSFCTVRIITEKQRPIQLIF